MRPGKGWLLAFVAGGTAIRLALAAVADGVAFDVESLELTRRALAEHGVEAYSALNAPGAYRWPYPPAFLAWIEAAAGLNRLTGIGYVELVQLLPIAADGALAWLVAWLLAARGAARRIWLAAGALVALGPSFILISGYAVQIDSVAILPALAALAVWERPGAAGRAWKAGLLIGLAASVKSVPGLMVLALLPTARDWREAATLVGVAVAVPAAMLAPFLVADAAGVQEMLRYQGAPGLGGLTLALQPGLADSWLREPVALNAANQWIADHQRLVNLAVVGGLGGFLLAVRMPPAAAAAFLWLGVWSFGTGFFFQYLVWGLPFLLVAGHLRAAALLQLATLAPAIVFYAGPWDDGRVVAGFVVVMLAVWAGWIAALAGLARRGVREHAARAR